MKNLFKFLILLSSFVAANSYSQAIPGKTEIFCHTKSLLEYSPEELETDNITPEDLSKYEYFRREELFVLMSNFIILPNQIDTQFDVTVQLVVADKKDDELSLYKQFSIPKYVLTSETAENGMTWDWSDKKPKKSKKVNVIIGQQKDNENPYGIVTYTRKGKEIRSRLKCVRF